MADPEQRSYGGEEDEDEDEEDIDESGYRTIKDAVLFAIEVSESMLTPPPPSDSKNADTSPPALAALKCAYHLMQQRIISQPKDMIGILLYGTELSKFHGQDETARGGLSYPHCYLLTDLDVPEAVDVKTLKTLVENDAADSDILKASKEEVSMANVLFCANQIFTTKAPNFASRRLFIVTDNDNPHKTEKTLRSSATVRAKDLYDLGVVIELFPISTQFHEFEMKVFYDDIIYRASPTDPDAPAYNPSTLSAIDNPLKSGDGISLLNSLLSSIQSKATAHRALFSSVPLELAPNLKISVKGYLLYKPQQPARSCYIYLEGETPMIAKGSTTKIAEDTTRTIEKVEVRKDYPFGGDTTRTIEKFEVLKAYSFGGEQISFSAEEFKDLRNFGDPVIRLIGFKPISMIPSWATTRTSTFLYPSEDDYVGSTRVFSALYQSLFNKGLAAIVWFIARRNAAPVLAALLPTLPTSYSEDGTPQFNAQSTSPTGAPQGLHLQPLPFADDIRQNPSMPHDPPLRAPDSLKTAMRPIIAQLQLPKGTYDPAKYPNPSLQWHYRILQALALEEDVPDVADDKTLPRYRQIDKRAGEMLTDWGRELESSFREYAAVHPSANSEKSVLAKRPAGGVVGSGASKKIKVEDGEAVSEAEVRKLWQKGKVGSLTVQQLKDFCATRRMLITGRKADLVDRVEGFLEAG